MAGKGFTADGVRRIIGAVHKIERLKVPDPPQFVGCQFARFVLDDDHEPGSQTQVHLLRDDGDGGAVEDDETTFDAFDRFGQFRGKTGSRGHAIKYRDTATWEMLSLEQIASRCRGQLTAAITTGTSTIEVDTITPLDGLSPTTSSTGTVTANNIFGWEGDDNAVCLLEYDRTNSQWHLYQVTCPSST
jgi:hypothetical protein